jgi:hypothetical protein
MEAVRQKVLRRFPSEANLRDPDGQISMALYSILYSIHDPDLGVDGWSFFRVVHESEDSLEVVGLMTLLPAGSVPIAMDVKSVNDELSWSARVALQDQDWIALSESKRWNRVYLYATGEQKDSPWTWGRRYQGYVRDLDT